MSDNIPEVNVQRRRKGSRPTTQAARPTRPSSGGYSGGSASSGVFGGGGSSSGGPVSGGTSGFGGNILRSPGGRTGCGGLGLIIILAIVYFVFLRGCQGIDMSSYSEPETYQQPEVFVQPTLAPTRPAATRTPKATSATTAGGGDQSWLVMVYQDADDQALEQDIYIDMNEMERMGSVEDRVMVVTQIDRFRGGYSGKSDFNSARRYLVTYDDDLYTIGSDLVQDLGEVNMADGETLVDFVTWAINTYPADKYVLIMSDHGMGWPGGWSDPSPASRDGGSAPLIGQLPTDSIYLNELDEALSKIQAQTGIDKFELIGMDACLMSQMEVYSALQPYAHYAVASEETEPGLGWAYSAFLSLLVDNPAISTAELATNIVDTYIEQDERVVDDQARTDFVNQNSNSGGFFGVTRISAEQLANQLQQNITLTAVNLDNFPELIDRYNDFVYTLQSVNQQAIANARSYTQSYTSIFGSQVPPSYIDLGHFIQMVYKKVGDTNLRPSAQAVLDALSNVIVAEKHGASKPGSTGIAIYFPNSQLYKNPYTGMQSYTNLASRFASISLWDDFLVYHYSNRTFRADAFEPVTPSVNSITRAPGSGTISVSQITTSAKSVSPGGSITLSANITGTNIGYIYLFTGLYDKASNSIFVADTDYLESPETESLEGVFYPSWPESNTFKMNFEFEPLLFTITDGTQSVLALFNPVSYGASAENAVYSVRGTYTFTDTGEERIADLYFKDGNLFQVMGFKGNTTAGQPATITPNNGDTFTIANRWLDLDTSGNITNDSTIPGETLVFNGKPFTWEQVFAPAGDYLIGFLVSDLDGTIKPAYTQITVK